MVSSEHDFILIDAGRIISLSSVSSTLLTLPAGNVLLDGGEGTLGQLFRHFGPEKLREAVKNLRMIFVSHLHADHHLGVVRVLNYWNEVYRPNN